MKKSCKIVKSSLFILQAEGYDIIACLAVNDPYVMAAWGKDMEADGKVRLLQALM